MRSTLFILVLLLNAPALLSQEIRSFPFDSIGVIPHHMFLSREGSLWISSSAGLWRLHGTQIDAPSLNNGQVINDKTGVRDPVPLRNYETEDSIGSFAQGPDGILYMVTKDQTFIWHPNGTEMGWGYAPFDIPAHSPVTSLWIHPNGDLFIGTQNDLYYRIPTAGKNYQQWPALRSVMEPQGRRRIVSGGLLPQRLHTGQSGNGIYCFAHDPTQPDLVWLGTTKGLFRFDSQRGQTVIASYPAAANLSISALGPISPSEIWFLTTGGRLGRLDRQSGQMYYYPPGESGSNIQSIHLIDTVWMSVAMGQQGAALFNTVNRKFYPLSKTLLQRIPGPVRQFLISKNGSGYLLKGQRLLIIQPQTANPLQQLIQQDSLLQQPFFRKISLLNGTQLASIDQSPEKLQKIALPYQQNSVLIEYDLSEPDGISAHRFSWRLIGETDSGSWRPVPPIAIGELRTIYLQDLAPGQYRLLVRKELPNAQWGPAAFLSIQIIAPYWMRPGFWIAVLLTAIVIAYLLFRYRIAQVRKEEQQKAQHEKQLQELEAKALRSQMNPHFIFNCLNSIKALIQQEKMEPAIQYLTTFSKLIRTLFLHADKRDISLYDECETCKLYLQLESMRFDARFQYSVEVQEGIDLKSVKVPALSIQPFIENALWHGIMPLETAGKVTLQIEHSEPFIRIVIDDNGIGRKASGRLRESQNIYHQSKGVNLTRERFRLQSLLQQQKYEIDIQDKFREDGQSAGTRVIITINMEE